MIDKELSIHIYCQFIVKYENYGFITLSYIYNVL